MRNESEKNPILPDPESYLQNPTIIGQVVGVSDKGKIKLMNMSPEGLVRFLWIPEAAIIQRKEIERDFVELELHSGAEIYIEETRRLKIGRDEPTVTESTSDFGLVSLSKVASPPPIAETPDSNGGGGGGGGCRNCDWRYITHCCGCNDRNSSRRCLKPFIPY